MSPRASGGTASAAGNTTSQGAGWRRHRAGRGEARAGRRGGRCRAGDAPPGKNRATGPASTSRHQDGRVLPAPCHGPWVGRGRRRGCSRPRRPSAGRDHRRAIDAWPHPNDASTEHDQLLPSAATSRVEGATKISRTGSPTGRPAGTFRRRQCHPLPWLQDRRLRGHRQAGRQPRCLPRADPQLSSPDDVDRGPRPAPRWHQRQRVRHHLPLQDSRNYYWFNITNEGGRSLNSEGERRMGPPAWLKDTEGIISLRG